jgi:lipase chaperone LimK
VRERQRKQADRGVEDADRLAELERNEAQQEREYEERYASERAAEEAQTEAPRDDTGKAE